MGVVVSYAHRDGKRLASALVHDLRSRGVRVIWDMDSLVMNPASIQEWMDQQIADNIVVCVVTPTYAELFSRPPEAEQGRSVRYESRAIRSKLHAHTSSDHCPVIPVVDATGPAEVPPVLNRLLVTRVDIGSGVGLSELHERIRGLGEPGSLSASLPPEDRVRRLLADLENSGGGAEGVDLVRQLLDLVEAYPDRTAYEFADAFPAAEKSVKAAGDLQAMRRLSDAVLVAVDRADPQLERHRAMAARVLICGRGWHLQREHQLDAALTVTAEGVRLAAGVDGGLLTEARGQKSLGRIHRLIAEDHHERREQLANLADSVRHLRNAYGRFVGILGAPEDEAGDARSLEGRTWLVHYRLTQDPASLQRAMDCVQAAIPLIQAYATKEYFDLYILEAEINVERHQFKRAISTLNELIEPLRRRPNAATNEILARALYVRALAQKSARPRNVQAGLRACVESAEIFERSGMPRAMAASRWVGACLNPGDVGVRVNAQALEALEHLEPDPAVRLGALSRLAEQERNRVPATRARTSVTVDWEPILSRICPRGGHGRRRS